MHWNLKAVQWAVYYFHCLVLCTVQCTVQCGAVCSVQSTVQCSLFSAWLCRVQCAVQSSLVQLSNWEMQKRSQTVRSHCLITDGEILNQVKLTALQQKVMLVWSSHNWQCPRLIRHMRMIFKVEPKILIQNQSKSLNIETVGWLFADMTMVACYQYGGNSPQSSRQNLLFVSRQPSKSNWWHCRILSMETNKYLLLYIFF